LQEAMMYSGAIHGVLSGQPSPYVNDGKRKSVEDIENFNESHSEVLETEGKIAILDEMREILKGLTPMMRLALEEEPSPHTSTVIVALTQRTMEARMWLGMELGRIRDANK
jgi:hypothetical protein